MGMSGLSSVTDSVIKVHIHSANRNLDRRYKGRHITNHSKVYIDSSLWKGEPKTQQAGVSPAELEGKRVATKSHFSVGEHLFMRSHYVLT